MLERGNKNKHGLLKILCYFCPEIESIRMRKWKQNRDSRKQLQILRRISIDHSLNSTS